MKRQARFVLFSALACSATLWSLAPRTARADPSAALDRVSVWLGAYRADVEGYASVRNGSGSIDTGDQKVLSGRETVNRARLDWLIMESQGFSIDYFRVQGNSERSVSRPFTVDGTSYGLDARIAQDTKVDIGNFSYRWWLGDADNNSIFGLGLGAAYYRLDATLRAQATAGPLAFNTIEQSRESGWAPLITAGWRLRLSDTWRIYADASGSRKNGNDLSGSITNAALGAEWFPWKDVGIGAEYAVTKIRFKREEDGDAARVRLNLHGPAVYLRMRF